MRGKMVKGKRDVIGWGWVGCEPAADTARRYGEIDEMDGN
jgi:hypothetical protein